MMAGCWLCGGATRADEALGGLGFVRCTSCGFVFRPDLDSGALAQIYEGGEYQERVFAA
jgi:hypothetical protein